MCSTVEAYRSVVAGDFDQTVEQPFECVVPVEAYRSIAAGDFD